jgi:hypothetical protein
MSLFPDITPLTNEVKKFNASQQEILTLLKELLTVQVNNEKHLSQIKQILKSKNQ